MLTHTSFLKGLFSTALLAVALAVAPNAFGDEDEGDDGAEGTRGQIQNPGGASSLNGSVQNGTAGDAADLREAIGIGDPPPGTTAWDTITGWFGGGSSETSDGAMLAILVFGEIVDAAWEDREPDLEGAANAIGATFNTNQEQKEEEEEEGGCE